MFNSDRLILVMVYLNIPMRIPYKMKFSQFSTLIYFSLFLLVSCGGARLIEKPEILEVPHPLATSTDGFITASLYWVIVRNGPGAWLENADWDEYLINVTNSSESDIQISNVIVIDSLDTRLASNDKLKKLIKESKKTAKRYHDRDIEMKSGYRPSTLYGAAAAGSAALGGAALGAAASTTSNTALAAGAAGGVAIIAAVVAIPVLIGAGVYRGVVNDEISEEIQKRSTSMPIEISIGTNYPLDIFFPIAPSPKAVEIHYTYEEHQRILLLDTSNSLAGLHLP